MRTTKLAALACSALVLVAGVSCGKTGDATPASNGGVIAESKSGGTSTTAKGGSGNTSTTKKSSDSSDSSDSTDSTTKTTSKKSTTTKGASDDVSIPDVTGLPGNLDDCLKAATAMGTISAQLGTLMSPTATKADLDKLNGQIDEVRKSVPSDIKGDFDVWSKGLADYASAFGQIIDDGGLVNPANAAKLDEVSKILDDPAWKQANDNIDKYFSTACK